MSNSSNPTDSTNNGFTKELIIIKSSEYQNDGCTFKFNFGRPVLFRKGSNIQIQSCSMYNSTFNITSQYGNNQMWITWLGTTVSITIPDGYYSYDEISALIEYYLIANDWYWVQNNIAQYPIVVLENAPRYKGQINITPIPSSAQATAGNYQLPAGATWTWPTNPTTPQIQMNAGLGQIFGFKSNLLFPPTLQSTAYSYISDSLPVVSPVYSYVLTTNMLNTSISPYNNNILGQIAINNAFGGLITYNTYSNQPIDVYPSKYSSIIIKFLDQNLNPIVLNDPEITLTIIINY